MGTGGWQRGPRYRPGKAAGTPAPLPLSTRGGRERGPIPPNTDTPVPHRSLRLLEGTGASGGVRAAAGARVPLGLGSLRARGSAAAGLQAARRSLPAALLPAAAAAATAATRRRRCSAAAGTGTGTRAAAGAGFGLGAGGDGRRRRRQLGGRGRQPPPAAAAAPPATAAPRRPWQGSGTQLSAQHGKRGTLTPPRMVGGTHTTAWTPQDPGGGLADRA